MARNVTTEWHDVQVKMGNFTPIELPKTGEEVFQEGYEHMEGYEEKKLVNNDSGDESDPDFRDDPEEDSEVVQEYREQRLNEIRELAAKPKFGTVRHITKQDYVQEVNDAPEDTYVVLVLYQDYIETSVKLVEIIESLALKHQKVKFLKSIATKTIPDFLDDHVPGILIYYNGEVTHQLIPALPVIGGKKMSVDIVEYVLAMLNIVECDLEDDPRDELYRMNITKIAGKKREDSDNSDEEDRATRGFMHTHHFKSYKK
jgi:hypothetical protein